MTSKQRLALLATIVGSAVVILDSTVVNLALPKIAHGLHSTFADLQWIVDGYLLTLSALILIGGSLGDIFGRKKIYLIGLVGFGAMSLACGLAPNNLTLVASRTLQGIFGALLVPGGLAIINTNFQKEQRGAAIGTWSAWSALVVPAGPIVGGLILNFTSWRWIFLINLPLIALCYGLASAGMTESRDEQPRRLDYPGSIMAFASLALITFGLIEGPVRHWSIVAWSTLGVGMLLIPIFIYNERRSCDPIVKLSLFKSANFTAANVMTFLMYGALGGFLFAFIIYLQTRAGYSSLRAGLSTLPLPIFIFLLSKRFGALSGKIGPRLFMSIGPIMAGLGMASLYTLRYGQPYWSHVLPGLLLFGFGMSLLVAPLTITVMGSVDDSQSGLASGINNAVSRVSGLIVVAVLGLLGTAQVYHFSILLCSSLAILSGLISFILVKNPAR